MNYDISSVSRDYVTHFALQPYVSSQQQRVTNKESDKQAPPASICIEGNVKIPVACDVIKQKLDEINQKMIGANKRVEYSFNERPRACIMSIVDTRTGEVVKEIPSKEILAMVADVWDRFGILMDEKR